MQDAAPFSLSVVVPNFNDAKYLQQCIESVVTQDVPPDEFIILDDASTDNSIEVIEAAIRGYPFARLERNPENLGQGGVPNANKGLSLATSKFVYFLGANDLILPGLFRKMKECLEQHPEAGLFSGMVWLVNEDGNYLRMHPSPVLSLQDTFIPARRCRDIMASKGSWLTGQTTVYRREALLEAGGFSASLKGLCDLLAAQVVASRYGAAFSPSPLGVMRIHRGALLVATVADSTSLENILDEVAVRGPQAEPALFSPAMLERTRLRFYFASLRLSQGATLPHVKTRVGPLRRAALALTGAMPKPLHTALYFLVMRPFDVLPTLWYRLVGASLILLREKLAGRVPPSPHQVK
jgi:cellulose synthase/poly-beta-1,6-N-acetylglucosamine synthase-like glycosyltransferase